ncbi:hypothetical protein INR49_024911 [Caranx melampygus]|nr:hypothetical protein INR49_024911 [Caranx melampygus]
MRSQNEDNSPVHPKPEFQSGDCADLPSHRPELFQSQPYLEVFGPVHCVCAPLRVAIAVRNEQKLQALLSVKALAFLRRDSGILSLGLGARQ